jgi:uncharacterized lipoprotein YddW (UPF0748 family)
MQTMKEQATNESIRRLEQWMNWRFDRVEADVRELRAEIRETVRELRAEIRGRQRSSR